MDSNIPHDIEDRLRNIELHAGIGKTDEEGNYQVEQYDASAAPVVDEVPEEVPDHDEGE
jgi:hypothetical protein